MVRASPLVFCAALAVASLGGCDRIPGTAQYSARAALNSLMFDPDAAKYTYDLETPKAVCGTVNGKNRMGAYVGATPFVYQKAIDFVEVSPGDADMSDIRRLKYLEAGDSEWSEQYHQVAAKCAFPKTWAENCGRPPPSAVSHVCELWDSGKGFAKLLEEAS